MILSFLTELHAFLRTFRAPADVSKIPKRPDSKSYKRFPIIQLTPRATTSSLLQVLQERRSFDGERMKGGVTLEDVSTIFEYGCKRQANGLRPFPSGGARYALELYILAMNVKGLERGAYHYNPEDNVLERLWDLPASVVSLKSFVNTTFACEDASALIVFSAMWDRSFSKYKGLAYPLVLTETGHAAQNVLLLASNLHLAARPLFAFKDKEISDLLRLVPTQEQVLYGILLGT